MADISLTSASSYDPQLLAIQRQQKLAEMLQQMGQQELPVSSSGGISAPISPMAALAKGLNSFGGAYLSGQAEDRAQQYGNSKLSDALMAKMAGSNVDPATMASITAPAAQSQHGVFSRAANWLGLGGDQAPSAAGPVAPTAPSAAPPVDAEGTPTGSYMLSPQAAPVQAGATAPADAAPASPYLAKLDQQAQYYAAYNPTTLQGKIDQQTGLIGVQQKKKEYLDNLPRYQAILASAPDTVKPQLQAALNTGDTALLDKYGAELAGKQTPQVTAAPKLNPEQQAKFAAQQASGLSPQEYDAQGAALKAKAEMPYKVQLARDTAAARLQALADVTARNPDAVGTAADYFIATGGKFPPNARNQAMQGQVLQAVHNKLGTMGLTMNDVVNTGIGIHARTAAATSGAKTQIQTQINEDTANGAAAILQGLLQKGAAGPSNITGINDLTVWAKQHTNDPDAANLVNGINSFSNEYARVMTGATTGAPSSDAARNEAAKRILKGYNSGTIQAVLGQMHYEMRKRSSAQSSALGRATGGTYSGVNAAPNMGYVPPLPGPGADPTNPVGNSYSHLTDAQIKAQLDIK